MLAQADVEARRIEAVNRYSILDTPPDGAFDRVTALAARLFDVPIAIVSIVDTDRIWFKSHHGLDVGQIDRDPGLCASAILHDGPWVVEDARTDPRTMANPLVADAAGFGFYLGIPLTTSDGHNLGTLCVLDVEPRQVTEREIANLSDLAAIVMDELELRLASIDRIASEAEQGRQAQVLARTLQDALLPDALPERPGLELAARYVPADLERVGGDFYEVIPSGSDTVLLIGDVCGHGPEAAAVTAMARHTLRTLAVLDTATPGQSLTRLNQAMIEAHADYHARRFCTVAAIRLRLTEADPSLTVSLGGHPWPLLLHADGTVEPVGEPGPLVGIFERARFTETSVAVMPGDTLLLYTDGLTEAGPGAPNIYDGTLQRILATLADQPAEVVADALLDSVRSTPRQRDDIAILVARIPSTTR